MTRDSSAELVRAALEGATDAIETLHVRCSDSNAAKEVSDLLLATLPEHQTAVEDWLHVIVEIHPDFAIPIGNALREKLRREKS